MFDDIGLVIYILLFIICWIGIITLWVNILKDIFFDDTKKSIEKDNCRRGRFSRKHDVLMAKNFGENVDLARDFERLSGDYQSIKNDIAYLVDQMKGEEWARERLYENSTRSMTILNKLDLVKDVLQENVRLHKEIQDLKSQNYELIRGQQR